MVKEDERVQGVDPFPRCGRGMGLLAEVFDDECAPGQGLADDRVQSVRVDLEDDVGILEHAVLDHLDLAAAPFLGRRADDLDRALDFRTDDGLEDDGGVRPGGGDDVVAAGVAEAGEGVHFGRERHPGPVGGQPGNGPERGREGARRLGYGEALGREDGLEQARRPDFLESELGVGMDPPAQVQDIGPAAFDFFLDFFG